jgi:hypothetical protein
MTNVRIVEVAVSDVVGHATLTLPSGGNNPGMFTLGRVNGTQSYAVELQTLDNILQDERAVDVIKMDIEGSEDKALRGAVKTLSTHRPSILIELNDVALCGCGSSASIVKSLLTDAGYRGWIIGRTKVQPILGHERHTCDECLFIHRDQAELISRLDLPGRL